jgi:hypothetical protein
MPLQKDKYKYGFFTNGLKWFLAPPIWMYQNRKQHNPANSTEKSRQPGQFLSHQQALPRCWLYRKSIWANVYRFGWPRSQKAVFPTWSIQNIQFTFNKFKTSSFMPVKNILNWTPNKGNPFIIARANDFDKMCIWYQRNVQATITHML